jgi:hypothetical protein
LTGYFTLPDKNAGQAILHFKNSYLARLPMLGTRYKRFLERKLRTKPLSQDATFILSAFLRNVAEIDSESIFYKSLIINQL